MDRLLRYFLKQFIRRGTMRFTTASGAEFSCGDGTGTPVSVRFLTTEAERRVLLNPELALGEIYVDGSFVVEEGSIADALAILLESYVSFLGYGIQPPTPSWGNMLENAQQYFDSAPWLAIVPGIAITLAVTSFNFVGDGLRDALDTRMDIT